MKTPLVLLLLLSLAGNAVLAVFVLRTPPAALVPAAAIAPTAVSAQAASSSVAVPVPPPGAPINWQTLKPDANLHTLVNNLRAAGFPPSVIRALANQMISDQVGPGAVEHLPFWKQNSSSPEFLAAVAAASKQRKEMLVDLLGADARPSVIMDPVVREHRYGQLSDDKVDQIESLRRDYSELRAQLSAVRKPGDMAGGIREHVALEEEMRADLATILTPAELDQYEMRTSGSANKVMSYLKGIEVNEAEYTALFRAQWAYDTANPMIGGVISAEITAQRRAAQDQLNEQARAILSDDRFYTYLLSSDFNYARTAQFTANYPDITPAVTYELTRIEREYQAAMVPLARTGTSGPASADRAAQMMAARKDYQDRITALLGPEVATAYAQRNRPGGTAPVTRSGP